MDVDGFEDERLVRFLRSDPPNFKGPNRPHVRSLIASPWIAFNGEPLQFIQPTCTSWNNVALTGNIIHNGVQSVANGK